MTCFYMSKFFLTPNTFSTYLCNIKVVNMPNCLPDCLLHELLQVTKMKKLRHQEILLILEEILYFQLPLLEPRAPTRRKIDHAEHKIRLLKRRIRRICKTLEKGLPHMLWRRRNSFQVKNFTDHRSGTDICKHLC